MTSEEVQIQYKKYLNIAFPLEVMKSVWKMFGNEFRTIMLQKNHKRNIKNYACWNEVRNYT